MKVLAVAAYPASCASTRFRMLQYIPYLRSMGVDVLFSPFLSENSFKQLYNPGLYASKSLGVAIGIGKRLLEAFSIFNADVVWIQREAAVIGPPWFEFLSKYLRGTPYIFDLDDAIWEFDSAHSTNPLIAKLIRGRSKCWWIIRNAHSVIAGSNYLRELCTGIGANAHTIPTVVPSVEWQPLPERLSGKFTLEKPVIGWVGSHTTAHQLELAAPALRRLRQDGYSFHIRVVGAGPGFSIEGLDVENVPWSLDRELRDFQEIDIGLAPMYSEDVYQGKCGFKQLQYMSVGVPFVSSWSGGAREFLLHEKNSLVARSDDDWYRHIKMLLLNRELRVRLLSNGLQTIRSEYCLERQKRNIFNAIYNAYLS